MTGGLRLPPNQKGGARLQTPSSNAYDPFVLDENDYHHESSFRRRPGPTTDELRNMRKQEKGGGYYPPVDAFDPFFVLDPDNYFGGSGLRGGRQLLAGSNSGSKGSLSSVSTEDDTAMLSGAYLPLAWFMIVVGGLWAMVLYKKSDKNRANAAQSESTMLREDDEWLIFRE
jgi:hypothetical protein